MVPHNPILFEDCKATLQLTDKLGEHLPSDSPTVRGLRRGPHFNLLLRAQAEGDYAAPAEAATPL